MTKTRTLQMAYLLGFMGLLPFILPLLAAIAGRTEWLSAQHGYCAVILAFLGALHWGPALNGSAQRPMLLLVWGVLPALYAWLCLYLTSLPSAVTLSLGLVVVWLADVWLARLHSWPSFYLPLRTALTAVASVCMLTPWLLAR